MCHGALIDLHSQARQHLAGEHQPGHRGGQQGGKSHPQRGGGDIDHQCQQVVEGPAEGGLRYAEPAVIVGHVAGLVAGPGHRQQVAIVGGIRANEVPDQQHGAHEAVHPARLPPILLHQAAGAGAAVQLVDLVQRPQCDDHEGQAEPHDDILQQRRGAREARIHLDVGLKPRVGGGLCVLWGVLELGVDAGQHRAGVAVDIAGVHRRVQLFAVSCGAVHPDPGGLSIRGDAQQCIIGEFFEILLLEGEGHHVADNDVQAGIGVADEEPAQRFLLRALRHGG